MPSIIEVDTIKNKTGTQNTVLSTDGSGNNTLNANTIKDGSATKTLATLSSSAVTLHSDVIFPTGHTIQTVIYTETTNFTQLLSGSGTEGFTIANFSGTNFGVSITPKVTGSKNLVTVSIGCIGGHNAGTAYSLGLTAYRDSAKVGAATGANTPLMSARNDHVGSMYFQHGCHFTFLDPTANTKDTQVVYTLKAVRHANSDYTLTFNRGSGTGSDVTTAGNGTTASYYIAQEVAQ